LKLRRRDIVCAFAYCGLKVVTGCGAIGRRLASSAYAETPGTTKIGDGDIGATFARTTDGLVWSSLRDVRKDVEFLHAGPGDLFQLDVRLPGGAETMLTSKSGWQEVRIAKHGDGEINLDFASDAGGGIDVHCHGLVEDGALVWDMTILTPPESKVSVLRTRFPYLQLAPIAGNDAEGHFHYPLHSGIVRQAPINTNLNFNIYPYPSGHVPYQMLGYYTKDTGIYIGTHDPESSLKNIRAIAKNGAMAVDFEWIAPNFDVERNGYKLPGAQVIKVLRGDWYDAARYYRNWVANAAPWWPSASPRDTRAVERLRDVQVWLIEFFDPKNTAAIDKLIAFAKTMSVQVGFHWYQWNTSAFDTKYPEFTPKDGFKEAIDRLHKANIRVMPYINVHVWDKTLPSYATQGQAAATKNEAMQALPYNQLFNDMCPASSIYRNKIREVVEMLNGLQVDGIYLDQLAAIAPDQCFDKSHGHPVGGGGWWVKQGYVPMLDELHRATTPGTWLTGEWNAEPYMHGLDGILTNHFEDQDQMPIFGSIYGGVTPGFGRYHDDRSPPDDQLAFRMKQGQAFVYGNQLGWASFGTVQQPPLLEFLRKLAVLRNTFRAYFDAGEMLRLPTIDGPVPELAADWYFYWKTTKIHAPALQISAWRHPKGRVAIFMANTDDAPLSATINIDFAALGLKSGDRLTLTACDDSHTLSREVIDGSTQRPFTLAASSAQVWELAPANAGASEQAYL